MPSRPVLIGRGLVTHTPTKQPPPTPTNNPGDNQGGPASTIQNLNQQTHQRVTRSQQNNGSTSYGGHSGRETPGPIPYPEVKPASADGTATERLCESRTPPNIPLQ